MIFLFLVFTYTIFCLPVRSNDFSTREQPIIREVYENGSDQVRSTLENEQSTYENYINSMPKVPVSTKSAIWGDVTFCAFCIFCLMCANYVLNLVMNIFLYFPSFLKFVVDHIILGFGLFQFVFFILFIWMFYYGIIDKVKSFFCKIMENSREQENNEVLT